jgi:hypothetical protein
MVRTQAGIPDKAAGGLTAQGYEDELLSGTMVPVCPLQAVTNADTEDMVEFSGRLPPAQSVNQIAGNGRDDPLRFTDNQIRDSLLVESLNRVRSSFAGSYWLSRRLAEKW